MRRRSVLAAAAALPLLPLAACDAPRAIDGRFTGIDVARGHALRDRLVSGTSSAPSIVKRTRVVIAGGGIAGLAAARALRLNGIEDFVLLEMEDSAGGNSRGGAVNGIACPLGAHYLPVPGDDASEVQDLLEELGLRQRVSGRWVYDEATLCHSPQERLFFQGAWQEGLLPMQGVSDATIAQYRRFEAAVSALQREARFTIPTLKSPFTPLLRSLDATTFAAWLDAHGLTDPLLRWTLDYCCRDDYGAGLKSVSAWAGLHYFAARHGFRAPGSQADASDDAVLTWPEGNGWLSRRLAAPLGDRLRSGCAVQRVSEQRHGVEVDAWDEGRRESVRWQAEACVVALPAFIAARVVGNAPDFLRSAAASVDHAPWLVANLHLREPLQDRAGAAPAWDNVIHADAGLGYVDARHQSLDPRPGPTVLSYYLALGDTADGRRQLLAQPWGHWQDAVLQVLAGPHPDIAEKAARMDITRYGHAMAIPKPGLRAALPQQAPATARLHFAHADWSGYSIFEEAFTRGHLAGLAIASRGAS